MIKSSASTCPVPFEQQPINEYEELKTSWLFSYCTLDRHEYIKKLVWIWCTSWVVVGPVAAATFTLPDRMAQFILCVTAGASLASIGSAAAVFGLVLRAESAHKPHYIL
jgi:hypothetical protein